jgi:two-component system cell cycle response regulator
VTVRRPAPAEAPPGTLRVLIADDDPVSRRILNQYVRQWGFEPVQAVNGTEAWAPLEDPATRLALLDWEMPGADGPALCRRLRAEAKPKYTYIILLTARDDPGDIIEGLRAGADDNMTKPNKIQELRARLQTGRRIVELEDKLLDSQKRLYDLATKDGLTGLWNRRTIIQFLDDEVAQGGRTNRPTSVIMIDIDDFKAVNDSCGHQAGDKILSTLAARLGRCVRPYDRVGRYGGDEILVVLPNCGAAAAFGVAERLRRACVRKPARHKNRPLGFTISIGCACSEGLARPSSDRLIHAGDQALYEAKRLGRDRVIAAEPAPGASRKRARHARPTK